jgi:hypothetical protein
MNNPIITASGVIPALSCVKVSTTANTVVVCTSAADTVFGVTFGADTANGGVVTFQTSDTQLDIATLRAGGTIAVGDQLVPTTAGAVVTAASGQFIAMSAATSGQNLTAYKKKVGDSSGGVLVYGSSLPGTFIKDLSTGVNSLDVIIFGDSNTGSALAGGYGYISGISQALNNLNAPCYGTSLAPFIDRSPSGASRFYGVWRGTVSTIPKDANFKSGLSATVGSSTNTDALPYAVWNTGTVLTSYGASTVQGTLTGVTITGTAGQFQCTAAFLQVNQQIVISGTYGGTGSITGYTNPKTYYIIATNGSTTFTLSESYSGAAIVTTAGTPTGLTYQSQADFNDWLYMPTTTDVYKTTGVNVYENHPLAVNGVVNFLRVRYGKVPSGGNFVPLVFGGGSANALPHLFTGASTSMSAASGQPTFDLYEASFTANGKGHTSSAVGYNYPSGTIFSKGPGALFCQSLYRQSKGWAVHAHAYQSGDDSTRIAQLITDTSATWIGYQLREMRERQIAASGTGRVLMFAHSGINGADTGSTWTAAHIAMWNKYKAVWSSLGYPASDLAIVSIVGVQKDQADNSGSGTSSNLVAVRAAANAMAIANPDMTVVDVKALMSYSALTSGTGNASYYQRLNNSPNVGSDIVVHLSGGTVQSAGPFTATTTTATSITLTGTSAVTTDGYWVGSQINVNTIGIVGVVITATTGVFTCTTMAGNLTVNQQINIAGTNTGTGTVTNGTYYITATNGTTQFTLSATPGGASITTTAGTPIGLTFTYYGNSAYQEVFITQYNGTTKVATVNQWAGGQPATAHNTSYNISLKYPSDGYTVISQLILSSLMS